MEDICRALREARPPSLIVLVGVQPRAKVVEFQHTTQLECDYVAEASLDLKLKIPSISE